MKKKQLIILGVAGALAFWYLRQAKTPATATTATSTGSAGRILPTWSNVFAPAPGAATAVALPVAAPAPRAPVADFTVGAAGTSNTTWNGQGTRPWWADPRGVDPSAPVRGFQTADQLTAQGLNAGHTAFWELQGLDPLVNSPVRAAPAPAPYGPSPFTLGG